MGSRMATNSVDEPVSAVTALAAFRPNGETQRGAEESHVRSKYFQLRLGAEGSLHWDGMLQFMIDATCNTPKANLTRLSMMLYH